MKDCFKLDLSKPNEGWIQIAPMLRGRYNFALVTANGLIYAVGGQDLNSEVNDIEVKLPLFFHFLYKSGKFYQLHMSSTHIILFHVGTRIISFFPA